MSSIAQKKKKRLSVLMLFTLRNIKRFGWNFGHVEYDWKKKPDYDHFKDIYLQWKKSKQGREE